MPPQQSVRSAQPALFPAAIGIDAASWQCTSITADVASIASAPAMACMPIGAAATTLTTSISHASQPIARRRRERASWRSEGVIGEAYPCALTHSTQEEGAADRTGGVEG